MKSYPIPKDIEQFVLEKIDSITEMEALLLLRNDPGSEWSVESVAKRLYVDDGQAAKALARLSEEALVIAQPGDPPRYRYEPGTPHLSQMVDRLAETYAKHLVPVTNLIHSKPKSRVQEFADAFKFRKDE